MTAEVEIMRAHIARLRKGLQAASWLCPLMFLFTALLQHMHGQPMSLKWMIAAISVCLGLWASFVVIRPTTSYAFVIYYAVFLEICGFTAVLGQIADSGGAVSAHTGGFLLAVVGVSFLLPLHPVGILVSYPMSLAAFVLTILKTTEGHPDEVFHIITTAGWTVMICGLGAWFHYRALQEAFSWRSALREEARRADLGLERARIARDLHDHIGARLTGIALRAEREQRRLTPDAHPALIWIQDTVRLCLEELRDTIWALSNSGRDARELVATLRRRAEDIADAAGLELIWQIDDRVWMGTLSPGVSVALSAILRESLTNTIRHSGAKKVIVQVERLEKVIRMTMSDDGRGMGDNPNEGRGLNNMRTRASEQHGEIRIERNEEQGVRIVAEIPWRDDLLQEQKAA